MSSKKKSKETDSREENWILSRTAAAISAKKEEKLQEAASFAAAAADAINAKLAADAAANKKKQRPFNDNLRCWICCAPWDKTRSFWDIESFTFPRARKWVSDWASERANEQTSGPVFTSRFWGVLNHCASSPGGIPRPSFGSYTDLPFVTMK